MTDQRTPDAMTVYRRLTVDYTVGTYDEDAERAVVDAVQEVMRAHGCEWTQTVCEAGLPPDEWVAAIISQHSGQ